MAASVTISGISKSYKKGTPVLLPIHLHIAAGELFFLLGPSGCGKSTLLRIIAGLLEPNEGKILFDDIDITGLPPEKRQAAMVFQNYALWPHLSVFENVAFGLRATRQPEKVIREKVADALSLVRMSDFAERRVPSLSGGQQQRVALARAVAVSPRVLLLDEPLSNLDAKLRDEMRLEISRICHERSLTAIYVTHDRREALSMGDRIALLDKGIIQQIGSPVELYRRPVNRFAAAFLGGVNFIRVRLKGVSDNLLSMESSIGNLCARPGKNADGEYTALIRPEAFSILRGDAVADGNGIAAEFVSGTFLGEHSELRFKAADGSLLDITASAFEELMPGVRCTLTVSPNDISLLED